MDVTLTDIPAALTHVLKRAVLNYQYPGAHYIAVSLFDADSDDDDDHMKHLTFMRLHNGRWTYALSGMFKRERKFMLEHFTKVEFVELQRYLTVQAHAHFDQFSTRAKPDAKPRSPRHFSCRQTWVCCVMGSCRLVALLENTFQEPLANDQEHIPLE